MSDSTYPTELPGEPYPGDAAPPDEPPPKFGVVDIVEAFTAMRHEWRVQTKESRALAEQVQAAVTNLQSLESNLRAGAANGNAGDSTSARQLVLLIVETDHQLSRAIAAIGHWEANRAQREATDASALEHYVAGMSRVARWFAGPLLSFIAGQRPAEVPAAEKPAIEGLNLVLARLRRGMHEHGIERLDTVGQVFDANTMHAIGTVASAEYPPGSVAEQLSPAYRWQGRLLCFAEVRVAK